MTLEFFMEKVCTVTS